ncbi:hypothetical protein EJB05_28801, partial [Eragrostis curvula]
MAEAVVGLLIGKLGETLAKEAAAYGASLLCTEASALKGFFGEIRRATSWLEIMKAFLKDSEKFKDTNETTDALVKKIRGLAFRMEDVVDEFKYKLEGDKHGGFAAKMKKRIQHVKVWRRLAQELGEINADLEDVAKQRNLCALPERHVGGSDHHASLTNETVCFAREEDLVGIKDNAEKVWIDIMDIFPNDCSSRFVFTSRNFDVASMATSGCAVKLAPLEENNSWKLFCNLAFRNVGDKKCPPELHNLAVKFLEKCDGLPLAIACIGRLLSCKPPTLSEWKKVYEELELQSSVIRGFDSILKVSLEHLSYELKNCFLHCAMFPEDYDIKRRRLIRHWITAGFIKEKGNKTLEEVAEDCLYEIINRSLLQVTKMNEFGRVKCCRMHDIVRHLALKRAEEECFCITYEGSGTFLKDGVRRLSLLHSANIPPRCESGTKHLRSIHAFTSNLDIDLLKSILASTSLLSTLDLQGTQIKVLPIEVFSLFNLRFLGIRKTRIEILPEDVGRLQNLEVLDACRTALVSLPKGVAKLKKLRFLYACKAITEEGGVKVPRGIRNLTGLRALQHVKASKEILCDVAALTELRTFSVSGVASEHTSNLCRAIMNMSHLVHLAVHASSENEVLPFEELRLPGTLYKLDMTGQLEKKRIPQILSSWSHLGNLTNLFLKFSKLDEDSFSSLMVLHGLWHLDLNKAYDGKKLCFPVQSFPKLRALSIKSAPQLNQFEIEEGALGSLAQLYLGRCPELKCVPRGIENLAALEELFLIDTAEELIEKLRKKPEADECNEELMKISHIRKISEQLVKTLQESFYLVDLWLFGVAWLRVLLVVEASLSSQRPLTPSPAPPNPPSLPPRPRRGHEETPGWCTTTDASWTLSALRRLSNEQLKGKTAEFRARLARGEMLADVQAEAFTVVREASRMRHFDVQITGGAVLRDGHLGMGEWKTLASTLAAYLNALTGPVRFKRVAGNHRWKKLAFSDSNIAIRKKFE